MPPAPDPRKQLAAVERHVAEVKGRVARQAEAVAQLRAEDRDAAEGEAMLGAVRQSLELLREHRERFLGEVAGG